MQEALRVVGLGSCMLLSILALYSGPSAAVKVNGYLSDAFPIRNGTRQGCPLSPLIYILTLEPLLNKLRLNPDIQGVTVKEREYKVVAFAIDILLSLRFPRTSLPNLLKDLSLFGKISNLKINHSKSYALNITLPAQGVLHCRESFPFRWEKVAITYLGIKIPTKISELYSLNHHMALLKAQ